MRRTVLALIALSVLFPSCISAQAKADAKDTTAARELEAIIRTHDGWGRLNSPGISLELWERKREGGEGTALKVTYRLLTHGIAPGEFVDLVQWPVKNPKPSTSLRGVSVLPGGLLACAAPKQGQCAGTTQSEDAIELVSIGPARGEPIRFAIANKTIRATAIAVPLPIEGMDNGCTLSAMRLLTNFEIAYIVGTGFPPDSEVHFDSLSLDEKLDQVFKTDANGNLGFVYLPVVEGHESGSATVWSRDRKCQPSVRFDWGKVSATK